MKRSASKILSLALGLALLLTACGGGAAEGPPLSQEEEESPPALSAQLEETRRPAGACAADDLPAPLEEDAAQPSRPEDGKLAAGLASALNALEETEWQIVSIDAEDYGIVQDPIGDPAVYGGAASLSLDRLIAFSLSCDGAAAEDLNDELRKRFLEAPNAMLAYLVLMGNQRDSYWNDRPAAEVICKSIACNDAAFYGGTEEFSRVLAACREAYPDGRIAELLEGIAREHAASLERNGG